MKVNPQTIGRWLLALLLATIGTGLGQTAASPDSLSSIQIELASGQVEPLALNATDMRAVRSLSEAQLAAFVLALDATPLTAFDQLPRKGQAATFYSLQHPDWPPLPANTSQSGVWKMNDFYLLDDVNYNYNAPVKSRMGMQTMSLSGPPNPGGGSGGTNVYFPNGSSYTPPDYGTNLYIAKVSLTNGYLTGIASNTLAGVPYEILTNGVLGTTNWGSTGLFLHGSETTNWTVLPLMPVSRTNSRFYRLRSAASSDGSGLPDWWEAAYGVTDPYGDPDSDGWNNLQEFQNGTSPLAFDTPPAPQGVTVNYNAINSTATLNWLPSPGPVTGYVITDSNGHTFTVSANATTFTGSVTNLPDLERGGNILLTYAVQASYAGGSSAAGALAPLEAVNFSGVIMPGPAGVSELLVSPLPAGTAALRLTQIGYYYDADLQVQAAVVVTNLEVAIGRFTNNVCLLPNLQATTGVGQHYGEDYRWIGRTVNTNGDPGAGAYLNWAFVDAANGNYQTNWLVPPFYAGQVQLKQNLIFQLRVAGVYAPFQYYINSNGVAAGHFTSPAGYAYAGFYDSRIYGNNSDYYSQTLNPLRPFLDNTLDRNFVFTSADVDFDGNLTTGANLSGHTTLDEPVAYQFQGDQTALLATNATRWLLYDASGLSYGEVGDSDVYRIGLVVPGTAPNSLSMSSGFHNWFGLAYVSAAVAYQHFDGSGNPLGLATDVLPAGETHSFSDLDLGFFGANYAAIYPETAQPQFQTVEYDFWQPATVYNVFLPPNGYSLPGNPYFSPTNASQPLIMTAVGSASTIAGYAKLAVQNGYSGVYGYLGQYFDQAYEIDTNGMVTTNRTGVLSPYGSFFATEPGPAALVTMPDPDTGERGTCIVHSVSLQLDKNHDGSMDSSFNGPDATSPASPMVCWVNNRHSESDSDALAINGLSPNYSYGKVANQRDLENFFRLWICGMPALTNGYQITLSWANISRGAPAINLYSSSDSAGGTGYLTDTNVAADQARTEMSPNPAFGVALAAIDAQHNYVLPENFFDYSYPYYSHFLFEGAGIGAGELVMTITDNNGNQIAQTGVWLDLHDVDDLFQRAIVTPRDPSGIPAPYNEAGTFDETTAGVDISSDGYGFTPSANEDKTALVFVHGSNLSVPVAIENGETMFKRLYWQGYNGRFVLFYWNTMVGPFDGFIPAHYNENEFRAFKYGLALKNYVENDLPAGYTKNVIGHSLGNMVITSALYPRGSTPGMTANNVIFMQAALPASCYDPDAATLPALTGQESSQPTPDWFSTQMGYRGLTTTNINATLYNIYNPEDYALGYWVDNQEFFKPENVGSPLLIGYGTTPEPGTKYEWDGLSGGVLYYASGFLNRPVTDPQESMSFIARSRTAALGTMAVGGSISTTNCLNVGRGTAVGLLDQRPDHSGEFTRPIQQLNPFYSYIYDIITKP